MQLPLVLSILAGLCCCIGAAPVSNLNQSLPASDGSNRCVWLLNSGSSITRFSSMPGGGWDNLRNKDMGLVADLSFTDCALSDDGMYVLPKNVILYPRKESNIEVMSEVIDHFSNYTSSLSVSINLEASGKIAAFRIGGKLSNEFQQVKKVAVQNKLDIGRSQLRYRLYSSKLQPDFKLSAALTNRLTEVMNALVNNQTKLARYLSDLIVRDFGTHVITSVEAGGILEKLDFFNSRSIDDSNFMQNKFSAAASFSFLRFFSSNISIGVSVTNEEVTKYKNSIRKMILRTSGGPVLGSNPKLDDWIKSLHENLVPIDRNGEPLYSVVNRRSLPNLPMTHMLKLRKEIEDAVMRYYKANTVKGCLDPNSRNFDPIANTAGQCEAPGTNFSFAGVYQQCWESNPRAGFNLCSGAGSGVLLNPITGGTRCPVGYEPVKLLSTVGRNSKRCWKTKHCTSWFIWCVHHEERTQCVDSYTVLTAYWCTARRTSKLISNPGMFYAGAYAADGRFLNNITQSKECPEHFRPYKVGRDIYLCLSMDLSRASRGRIPFAGFFSCDSGNPLSETSGGLDAPKHCPKEFSQVTLDTVDGCAIMQCVKGRSGLAQIQVRRPPFEEPDYELVEHPVTVVKHHGWRWSFNITQHVWRFLGFFGSASSDDETSSIDSSSSYNSSSSSSSDAESAPYSSAQESTSESASPSPAGIAALVGIILGIAGIVVLSVWLRRRCARCRSASDEAAVATPQEASA